MCTYSMHATQAFVIVSVYELYMYMYRYMLASQQQFYPIIFANFVRFCQLSSPPLELLSSCLHVVTAYVSIDPQQVKIV